MRLTYESQWEEDRADLLDELRDDLELERKHDEATALDSSPAVAA